jgi:adenylate kinase family enzyme
MIKIAFLLGRPGSGKSTVADEIRQLAKGRGWTTQHIFDYRLLQNIFLQEKEKSTSDQEKKFLPKGPEECKGFDVRDFSVLDTVLEEMADEVQQAQQRESEKNELILLEFARDNYTQALFLYGPVILRDAYLLYMKADLDICIGRVRQRVECDCLKNLYNHFVSDDIMRGYYRKDDWSEVTFNLRHTWGISVKTLEINNMGDYQALRKAAKRLVETELMLEPVPV